MMGWQKTMKLIKYLALFGFLISCSQLTHASPRPDGATKANNSPSLNNSSSSSNSAATNRERSTKVSSERMKGKFYEPIYITQDELSAVEC